MDTQGDTSESGQPGDTGPDDGANSTMSFALPLNTDIDILFVIDDTEGMGGVQATLARGIGAFIDALESGDVAPNLHIAITTTDDGNSACSSSSESGSFVLSSCNERLDDFVTNAGATPVSISEDCTSICELEEIDLQPSTTTQDPNVSVRPWLQSGPAGSNLSGTVSLTEALKCAIPQGTVGCRFESPMEAMKKSLERSQMEGQDEFGFLRDHALLAVLMVTNEADCSANDPLESSVFRGSSTDAACWDAGVRCDWSLFSEQCTATNTDISGSQTTDAFASVLTPVDHYTDFLAELDATKKERDPGLEVMVAGLVGVPEDYPATRSIQYSEPVPGDAASFDATYGVGPGCSAAGVQAVPPVRMRAFAEQFPPPDDRANLFSVCSEDYRPALTAVAESLRDQLDPACVPACVADTDPDTDGLQTSCTLVQSTPDGVEETLVPCEQTEDSQWVPPADRAACYVEHTTPQDMSTRCVEQGWNLEFEIVRAPGVPTPPGASVVATCEVSSNRALDCPGLPPA